MSTYQDVKNAFMKSRADELQGTIDTLHQNSDAQMKHIKILEIRIKELKLSLKKCQGGKI